MTAVSGRFAHICDQFASSVRLDGSSVAHSPKTETLARFLPFPLLGGGYGIQMR